MLIEIDPQYLTVSADKRKQLQAVKHELEKETPEGAPADPFAAREKAKAGQAARRQGDRPDLREDLNPRPVRIRGGGLRRGRARDLPGPSGSQLGHKESIADTARVLGRMYDGIEFRGNKQADIEEPRRARQRAGIHRPDRRVASDVDARRLPHHARGQHQAPRCRRLRVRWRLPFQHRQSWWRRSNSSTRGVPQAKGTLVIRRARPGCRYLRLLAAALPLTIGLGTLLALALDGSAGIWLALQVGAALAPTAGRAT